MSEITSVCLSEDAKNFAITLAHSYQIYSLDPVKRKYLKDFVNCTITAISVIDDPCMIAFSSKHISSENQSYKVYLLDNKTGETIDHLTFHEEILSLLLSRQYLLIVLLKSVIIYDIEQRKTQCEQLTFENRRGAADFMTARSSLYSHNPLLAICSLDSGSIQISEITSTKHIDFADSSNENLNNDLKDFEIIGDISTFNNCSSPPIHIHAHNHPIAVMKFSPDGSLLATASEKGTVIRIFDTVNGRQLSAFRRGSIPSNILSFAFSPDNTKLIAISDSGTVHLFPADALNGNPMDPPRSTARLKIEKGVFVKSVFLSNETLYIVSSSGHLLEIECQKDSLNCANDFFILSH